MSELEQKIREFEIKAQSKKDVLANIKKLREALKIERADYDKEQIQAILKKTGSLSDEVLRMREQDRE